MVIAPVSAVDATACPIGECQPKKTHLSTKTTRFNSSLQDLHVLHSPHYGAWVLRISLLGVIIAIAGILDALPFEDKLLHMEGCQNKLVRNAIQAYTSKIYQDLACPRDCNLSSYFLNML